MIERNLPLKNVPRRLSSFAADGESRSVPKYELLKRALLDYISELPPEREFLPYEKELAGEFGVSRCTVTKALEKLRRGGYIETSKKSGSRIIRRSLPKPEEYREPMQNIAFLFANNEESTARTTDFRWQLLDETEPVLRRRRSADRRIQPARKRLAGVARSRNPRRLPRTARHPLRRLPARRGRPQILLAAAPAGPSGPPDQGSAAVSGLH